MKKTLLFALAFVLTFAVACKSDKKEQEVEVEETVETETSEPNEKSSIGGRDGNSVWVVLESKSGSDVKGNVVFEQEEGRVTMVAAVSGLEANTVHAIHLHESSDCSADDGTSTGGHWNPTGQPHGQWGASAGYHKGDIGNFTASEDGRGTLTFTTDEWCIGCGDDTKDILGKAVIIHQGQDDFVSQPTGAAGGRVSCGGVIE